TTDDGDMDRGRPTERQFRSFDLRFVRTRASVGRRLRSLKAATAQCPALACKLWVPPPPADRAATRRAAVARVPVPTIEGAILPQVDIGRAGRRWHRLTAASALRGTALGGHGGLCWIDLRVIVGRDRARFAFW